MDQQLAVFVLEAIALVAFAASGLAAGLRHRMDAVGLATVAFVTAFGGGTLRDVLLDRRPFVWVEQVELVWAVLALALVVPPLVRGSRLTTAAFERVTASFLLHADAIGLGLFTVSGTVLALDAGMPALVAAMMGVITATFGGVLRDLLCARVPALLSDHRPYALCSFAGAWTCIGLLRHTEMASWQAMAAGAALAIATRLLAAWRGWRLPALR